MKATRADKLIVAALFVLTVYSFNVQKYFAAPGKVTHVFLDGDLKYKIALNVNKEYTIPVINGEMKFEVKGGKLFVTKAPCPLNLCMKESPIKRKGESIVCVPNKALFKIISGEDDELDSITK